MNVGRLSNLAWPSRLKRLMVIGFAFCFAGCHKSTPSGQVVASVNGRDITASDLAAEFNADGVRPEDQKAILPAVLQNIIERTLWTQSAEKDGLDKQPGVVLQVRRAQGVILAQAAIGRTASLARVPPKQSEVDSYRANHPELSGSRVIYEINEIRFNSLKPADLFVIKKAGSLDSVGQALTNKGIQFVRMQGEADSALIPNSLYLKLRDLKIGQPTIEVRGPTSTAIAVSTSRASPSDAVKLGDVVRERLTADRVASAVRQQSQWLMRDAKISYADGYAPKAK